jgi:hypothetical protein
MFLRAQSRYEDEGSTTTVEAAPPAAADAATVPA